MRIAVDYRVLSTEAASRGMGRYTQQQLREVLKRDKENEYLVVCYLGTRRNLILPEIRSATNVKFAFTNLDISHYQVMNVTISEKFQDFLYTQKVDLFHSTTPFVGSQFISFDVCPLVATLYDLIPFIFPREYLNSPGLYEPYMRALNFVQGASQIISISESAREDLNNYVGYPLQRMTTAYPCIDPEFAVLPNDAVGRLLKRLRRQLGLTGEYILSVTGIHHSKNAATLIKAYAQLPATMRKALPLLIVCPTLSAYTHFRHDFELPDHVMVTHSVSEYELAALYNAALFVVHPSRYEGFGYPVVEAMKCGAPVITTTSSSLAEISADAAILVDPDDVAGITDAMVTLYNDPHHRAALREKGLRNTQRFNPDQLGQTTLAMYRAVLSKPVQSVQRLEPRPLHIAMWGSLPPLKCGVGDYTYELLQGLTKLADVEMFVDGTYTPPESVLELCAVHHFSAFARRDTQHKFDVNIYQMGGTSMQSFMYEAVRKTPGIVVLHDLLMGWGFYHHFVRVQNDPRRFRDFVALEGPAALAEYDAALRLPKSEQADMLVELLDRNYLLGWIVSNSLAHIVHMPEAKRDLDARYPNTHTHVVDMGVVDPWQGRPTRNHRVLRQKFGIRPSTLVLGIFGSVVKIKRIEQCIQALQAILKDHRDTSLLVVGDLPDHGYVSELHELVAQLGLQSHVQFTGRVSREHFDDLFLSCDVILNLRYPSRKGMSAILIRALAAGKPVVISDVPEWSHFPETFCWRVKPDQDEVRTIVRYLSAVAKDSDYALSAARQARDYFVRNGTIMHMASQYIEVVHQVLQGSQIPERLS